MDVEALKKRAGERAVDFVRSGMVLGLGHGSTAIFALRKIARLLAAGELRDICGVPCSREVEADARELGIPLATLEAHPVIDLTIDGADEVDPHLNVIKGGGGALLREKIVAQASRREIIVVDESKLSPALGSIHRVPIEVTPFGWRTQIVFLEALGAQVTPRAVEAGRFFETDQGNMILDCDFEPLYEPRKLADQLNRRAGIVAHGLFLGLTTDLIVAGEGGVRHVSLRETDKEE